MTTTTPPQLKRLAYHAWVAPEGIDPDTADDQELEYFHVVVTNADQLRAERESARLKLDPRRSPMHLTNLWMWCSMVRTGRYSGSFEEWKTALVSYDPDRDRDSPHTDDLEDQQLDDLDARPTGASTS